MTIAASVNSSIRRVVVALLITASVVACSDTADEPATGTAPSTSPAPSSASASPTSSTPASAVAVESLRAEVIARRPHDKTAFTEGLEIAGGKLYEGTGLRGESVLRESDPRTGVVSRRIALDDKYFGEGITVVDDSIVQLTYQEHVAFVYRLSDFKQISTYTYDTEGWGLCDDGTRFVMSDGTNQLYLRDRASFAIKSTVAVTNNGVPVDRLNELECVDGQVYANVWQTDTIVRIDPATGKVTAVIDASGLLTAAEAKEVDVLNGIAYDASKKSFLITGKYWPTMFEVRFVTR